MRYISTRGQTPALSFSDAVATGLAPDGGLFLPEQMPDLSSALPRFEKAANTSYAELCFEFMRLFATDIPAETLRELVHTSYTRFSDPAIAPLKALAKNLYVLELFHGPTLAFKDFALQLLGNLYAHQCKVRKETINVLGATSGDTGAAAIHGLIGRPGTAIFILYPDGRVSPLQERQMACTGADNVFAIAVDGTFDDAQSALKEVFGDQKFRTRHRLSAVNSINLARVLAQCVYYLHAWLKLPASERANVEFIVPTGNFGNVLAGWMLQKMGVPIRSFRVATNQNDILYRLFTTGEYRVGDVHPSLAPSMDIQVASNFERFIYFAVGRDSAKVRAVMEEFAKTGRYNFGNFSPDTFSASRATDADIRANIKYIYDWHHYVADPHTACGFMNVGTGSRDPSRVQIVLSTASPAKFPDTIREAIGIEPTDPSLDALKSKPIVKHRIKATPDAIRAFIDQRAVG